MRRLLKVFLVLGLVATAAFPAVAWVLDRAFGQEVLIITPHAPEQVSANRELWAEGDPVPDLYGVPTNEPVRVLFPFPSRLIRPPESRDGLVLLAVDKQAGENPLQARSVWFIAWRASAAALAASIISLLGLAWIGWRG